MIEFLMITVPLFYVGWGCIWNIYCIFSTIWHPSYEKMGFTPYKMMVQSVQTIFLWPYIMYAALKKVKEEGQKIKDRNKGIM